MSEAYKQIAKQSALNRERQLALLPELLAAAITVRDELRDLGPAVPLMRGWHELDVQIKRMLDAGIGPASN